MRDLRVPRTDPLLPPGMTDRDVECPGDEDDGWEEAWEEEDEDGWSNDLPGPASPQVARR